MHETYGHGSCPATSDFFANSGKKSPKKRRPSGRLFPALLSLAGVGRRVPSRGQRAPSLARPCGLIPASPCDARGGQGEEGTARRATPGFAYKTVGPALRALTAPYRAHGVGLVKRSGPADWGVEMAPHSRCGRAIHGATIMASPTPSPAVLGRAFAPLRWSTGPTVGAHPARPCDARGSQGEERTARRACARLRASGGGSGAARLEPP